MNFSLFKDLCTYFDIGNIKREFKVVREIIYYIDDEKNETRDVIKPKDEIG